MKALTLTQPWATLIALGAKKIETRSWATNYRGPLAIHAAQGLGPVGGVPGLIDLCSEEPFLSTLKAAGVIEGGIRKDRLPRGAIVAVCELKAIARVDRYIPDLGDSYDQPETFLNFGIGGLPLPDEPELSFGDYSIGRYAWELVNIRALSKPIPAKGAQGLWNYEGVL